MQEIIFSEETNEVEIFNVVDLLIKIGIEPDRGNSILREFSQSSPEKRISVIKILTSLADEDISSDNNAKMDAYKKLCKELAVFNEMRGGMSVFKNFVDENSKSTDLNAVSMVDSLIKIGVEPERGNDILREFSKSAPEKKKIIFGAMSVLSDSRPFVEAAVKMDAYSALCNELSELNTMRGGAKGFKGFVAESMTAANANASGRAVSVVNNNGPVDLIFQGKNGHKYPQQLKIGYKPGQIDFSEYKGQTVIFDKSNKYIDVFKAEGKKYGVNVVEGTVTEAEAKFWADAMQFECKHITGDKYSYIVPKVQEFANDISVMHKTGLKTAKTGALYGAGFSIGSNIVKMMHGEIDVGEAAFNVARDTAVSGGAAYVAGAAGSALGRTAAGRLAATAMGTVGTAIEGTAIGGAIVGAAGSATAAVGTTAAAATAAATGAIGTAGAAVGSLAVSATAGTAIGGAVASGVAATAAAGTALATAAVAAAPVLAVGAIGGAIFSFISGLFDD